MTKGGKGLKVLDVQDLFGCVDKTVSEINDLQNKLKNVLETVNEIVTLDESFAGQGAIAIKSYYAESHIPFIGLFGMILEEYREALQNLKSAVSSYESSQIGFIRQAFLEGDVVKYLNQVREVTNSLTSSANSVILGVRDIVSTKLLNSINVHIDINQGKNTVEEYCENLEKLDRKESDNLNVFVKDLQLLKSYLTDIRERFSNGDITIRHYDSSMLGDIPNYNKMVDRLEDYEEGLVDPPIASFDPKFLVDAPDDYFGYATEALAFKDLYQKVRQGFKIERDVIIRKAKNGAMIREYKYRVYKPELVGIKPPKKGRNYKVYESRYINSQLKNNPGSLKVANYVKPGTAAVNALKSKAGWAGIAIGTGWGIYENIKEGESVENIAAEAIVDVGIGALSLAAAGAATAAAITFGAPVLVGAAVGFVASVAVGAVFDGVKIKGVSVGDHIKNGLKTVAGWFTGKK